LTRPVFGGAFFPMRTEGKEYEMSGRSSLSGIGSVEKTGRKNTWRIRVALGKDTVTGKYRKSPSRTVHGTKSEATKALMEYRAEIMDASAVRPSDITVGEYAVRFHEEREHEFRSPLAWNREAYEIKRIAEAFGAYRLQELDTLTLRSAYSRMRKEGATESRLHRVHQKLSQIMNQAVDDGLVAKNPCSPISIPRPKPKERHSLTVGEAQRLNSTILGMPVSAQHCAVLLALHTGMRRGEVLGLTWEHVHFDKRKLYVAQQYASDKVPRDPKSKKSKRWISLDSEIVAYLEEWKRVQRSELEARKRRLEGEDTDAIAIPQTEKSPVVSNVYGGYYDPNIFGRWFREFCVENGFGEQGRAIRYVDSRGIPRIKRTGYEGLKFHELRHTQATLLISNGADIKTVQNRLGHSTAALTMDIYAHAIEQNDREAADEIGELLGGE